MTAPAPEVTADVTRDPYVLLTACLTFHKLPPELRKAIKECVDARPVAPVASKSVEDCMRLADEYAEHESCLIGPERAALEDAIVAYGDAQWNAGRDAAKAEPPPITYRFVWGDT